MSDRLAAYRMEVDREFADRVRDSKLDRQQWSMAMTAVEFRVEDADDPEAATLVADTSKVGAVLAELEDGDGGLLDGLPGPFGSGSGLEDEVDRLAGEYAAALEAALREAGEWEAVRHEGT